MLSVVRNVVCSLWRPIATAIPASSNSLALRAPVFEVSKRFESNYDPYPKNESPSPYQERRGIRRSYEYKLFDGGLLPRPEGEWEDKPLPMPRINPVKCNNWSRKKALFGQNDYIDILGDGSVHPWELIRAPSWLKGYRGNELQRISRQLGAHGTFLRETFPSKYHSLVKQLFFKYKRLNRRRHAPYWGGYRRHSRIDKPGM